MPESSISFQAFRSCTSSARPVEENPAGLRKVDPAERSFVGWLASRRASCYSLRRASAAGSPGGPVSVTSVTTRSAGSRVVR